MNQKKLNSTAIIRETAVLTAAVAIIAAAVFFFLSPSHTSVSSISGLGIVLSNFIPLPLSAITMILNIVLLIIGGLMSSAGGKKLQGAAQGGLAQAAMEQVLEEAEYRPGSCIDGGKFAESGLGLPSADNVGGSGLVCGCLLSTSPSPRDA